MLSKIALVIISSLLNIYGHLSNVILLVNIVDLFVYLISINWKNNFDSSGLISLNPTSSIINSLYLKNCLTFLSNVPLIHIHSIL